MIRTLQKGDDVIMVEGRSHEGPTVLLSDKQAMMLAGRNRNSTGESQLSVDWIGEDSASIYECSDTVESSDYISRSEASHEQLKDQYISPESILSNFDAEKYGRCWVRYLGVQNKAGIAPDYIPTYDDDNFETIKDECARLSALSASSFSATDIEMIVAVFCEREECEFDLTWMHILEILLPLKCTLDQLYNIFHSIITKFIPRCLTSNAICYQLMYLILQYHEPDLCNFLNSHRITVFDFSATHFSTLFASTMKKELIYHIWNRYFQKGDPFMLFTMVLAFVINSSEDVKKLKCKKEIIGTIDSSTKISPSDLSDFFDVASYFLQQTPSSIKKDFQYDLFGPRNDYEKCWHLEEPLALPIDVRDIMRKHSSNDVDSQDQINFFIVDARPHVQYAAGHIEGSYNLDCTLLVDNPEKYNIALSSLDAYRVSSHPDDHLLFIGSGREEFDSYLHLVIANFLHEGRKHIAVVNGGYRALHAHLIDSLHRLYEHCTALCVECAKTLPLPESERTNRTMSLSLKVGINNIFGAVKASAPSLSKKLRSFSIGSASSASSGGGTFFHVNASERHGRRYRNEPSVFTLSDSDSETEDGQGYATLANQMMRNFDEITASDSVQCYFEGMEIWSDDSQSHTVKCYLVLTESHIEIYHQMNNPKEVVSRGRHSYESILRLASKKKIPEILTFKFGYCMGDDEFKVTSVRRFAVPLSGDCAKAVKTNIAKLWPDLALG